MKALFFDIDGTLVSFKTHEIPQSAVEAISRAHSLGHKIIIATGRPTAIINNLGQLQSQGLIDAYITMNGAYCYAGNKVLHSQAIAPAEAAYLAAECKAHRYPCIFVGQQSMTIAGEDLQSISIFAEQLGAPPIPVSDYDIPLTHALYQLTPFFPEDKQGPMEQHMPNSEFARWHPAFVDITAKGNNKAYGMDIMLEHFGIDRSKSIAFGDGGNDIPMLQHAGIGVAMGNASPAVKQAASYVTASVDEDGIAQAINQLVI